MLDGHARWSAASHWLSTDRASFLSRLSVSFTRFIKCLRQEIKAARWSVRTIYATLEARGDKEPVPLPPARNSIAS